MYNKQLDMRMNLYEYQSTVNPNMPLRYLMYVSSLFEKVIKNKDLYSRKQILFPTPKFVVLYNGEAEQPVRKEMRLSDSFIKIFEYNEELHRKSLLSEECVEICRNQANNKKKENPCR